MCTGFLVLDESPSPKDQTVDIMLSRPAVELSEKVVEDPMHVARAVNAAVGRVEILIVWVIESLHPDVEFTTRLTT